MGTSLLDNVNCSCGCVAFCREGVEPMEHCVNQLGGVGIARCDVCDAYTYHKDGECLRKRVVSHD